MFECYKNTCQNYCLNNRAKQPLRSPPLLNMLQSLVGAFDSRGTIPLDSQSVDLQKHLSHVPGFS